MRKTTPIKIITIIILLIAAISLVFGSFIMLLGNTNENQINNMDENTLEYNSEEIDNSEESDEVLIINDSSDSGDINNEI